MAKIKSIIITYKDALDNEQYTVGQNCSKIIDTTMECEQNTIPVFDIFLGKTPKSSKDQLVRSIINHPVIVEYFTD